MMEWPIVFAFLGAWARVRRIVAGRHVLGRTPYGAPIVHYTTPEAVQADFGSSRIRRELDGTPEVRALVEEARRRVAELGLTETVHDEWPPSERRISATLERD